MDTPSRRRLLQGIAGAGVLGIAGEAAGIYDVLGSEECPDGTDPVWQWTRRDDTDFSPPTVAGDAVLVASRYGIVSSSDPTPGGLHALDRRTGEELWHFESGELGVGLPRVTDRRVYVGTADDHVYALDRESGEVAWRSRVAAAEPLGGYAFDAPLLEGDRLLAEVHHRESRPGRIVELDAETGERRWTAETEFSPFDVVHSGADLVVSTTATESDPDVSRVLRLDADGRTRWETDLEGDLASTLAVGDRAIVSLGATVYGIDVASGRVAWSNRVLDADEAVVSSTARRDLGLAVFGTTAGRLVALDADTGDAVWETSLSPDEREENGFAESVVDVAAVGSVLLVATSSIQFLTVDPGDGTIRSRGIFTRAQGLSAPGNVDCAEGTIPLAGADADRDHLYVATDYEVYAFPRSEL